MARGGCSIITLIMLTQVRPAVPGLQQQASVSRQWGWCRTQPRYPVTRNSTGIGNKQSLTNQQMVFLCHRDWLGKEAGSVPYIGPIRMNPKNFVWSWEEGVFISFSKLWGMLMWELALSSHFAMKSPCQTNWSLAYLFIFWDLCAEKFPLFYNSNWFEIILLSRLKTLQLI